MKKLLVFMLALVLVASVFAGCVKETEETPTSDEATQAPAEATEAPVRNNFV